MHVVVFVGIEVRVPVVGVVLGMVSNEMEGEAARGGLLVGGDWLGALQHSVLFHRPPTNEQPTVQLTPAHAKQFHLVDEVGTPFPTVHAIATARCCALSYRYTSWNGLAICGRRSQAHGTTDVTVACLVPRLAFPYLGWRACTEGSSACAGAA